MLFLCTSYYLKGGFGTDKNHRPTIYVLIIYKLFYACQNISHLRRSHAKLFSCLFSALEIGYIT